MCRYLQKEIERNEKMGKKKNKNMQKIRNNQNKKDVFKTTIDRNPKEKHNQSEGIDTTKKIEDKLKNTNPYLFLILKYATSFGAIFTITVGVFPGLMNYFNQIIKRGYCEYLGLNNLVLNIEVSSYWNNLVLGLLFFLIIYFEAMILYKFKDNLSHKVILFPCLFMEITLFFVGCILFAYGNSVIEIIQFLWCPILIFIVMIISYYNFIMKKGILTKTILAIVILALCVGFVFNLKQIEIHEFAILSFLISNLIYIPYYIDGLDRLTTFNNDKKDNQNKIKMWLYKKIETTTVIYLMVSIAIVFVASTYYFLNMSSWLEHFYNYGIKILHSEEVHQIIEETSDEESTEKKIINKYLLLETTNNEKILMKITNPTVKGNKEELKTYLVSKGEFSYLTDYNRLTIKTEECKIDIKNRK